MTEPPYRPSLRYISERWRENSRGIYLEIVHLLTISMLRWLTGAWGNLSAFAEVKIRGVASLRTPAPRPSRSRLGLAAWGGFFRSGRSLQTANGTISAPQSFIEATIKERGAEIASPGPRSTGEAHAHAG